MNWIFECYREIIPEFSQFCKSLTFPLPLCLRVNTLKIELARLMRIFDEKGIRVLPTGSRDETVFHAPDLKYPGKLIEYFTGYIHPQALTSCLASPVLSPGPGDQVLDLCASPGGKTSHLAQLMKNRGLIVANELHVKRHISLAHTMARLGVVNTVFTAYQAQEFPLKQDYDYVLADVPCSGEGRIRNTREGSLREWDRETSFYGRLVMLQKRIIIRGYDLLKQNGEMLYATCTYNPDENESVVNFLLENRNAELLPISTGFHHEPGLTRWRDQSYDKQLELAARFYPHRVDSVGFFMARIVRRG